MDAREARTLQRYAPVPVLIPAHAVARRAQGAAPRAMLRARPVPCPPPHRNPAWCCSCRSRAAPLVDSTQSRSEVELLSGRGALVQCENSRRTSADLPGPGPGARRGRRPAGAGRAVGQGAGVGEGYAAGRRGGPARARGPHGRARAPGGPGPARRTGAHSGGRGRESKAGRHAYPRRAGGGRGGLGVVSWRNAAGGIGLGRQRGGAGLRGGPRATRPLPAERDTGLRLAAGGQGGGGRGAQRPQAWRPKAMPGGGGGAAAAGAERRRQPNGIWAGAPPGGKNLSKPREGRALGARAPGRARRWGGAAAAKARGEAGGAGSTGSVAFVQSWARRAVGRRQRCRRPPPARGHGGPGAATQRSARAKVPARGRVPGRRAGGAGAGARGPRLTSSWCRSTCAPRG
jgi:hypothetical protein